MNADEWVAVQRACSAGAGRFAVDLATRYMFLGERVNLFESQSFHL